MTVTPAHLAYAEKMWRAVRLPRDRRLPEWMAIDDKAVKRLAELLAEYAEKDQP